MQFSWLVVWIKGLARFYRKGYLNYLSTPDYQYWLAGFTPELDPNLKPPTHINVQTNPGSP